MRLSPLILSVAILGCSPAPRGVGLTGTPKYRDEDPIVANDMKSVSIRKEALVTQHDGVASEHCGGDCLYERRVLGTLALMIEPNGVVSATNEGEQLEQFRSSAGNTEHSFSWKRTWSGSWTEGEGRVVIELRPEGTDCKGQPSDQEGAPRSCQDVPLKLICAGGKVPLYRPKNKRARAWVCQPVGKVVPGTGLTPFPWIFGVDDPVAMSDRSGGRWTRRFLIAETSSEERGAKPKRR